MSLRIRPKTVRDVSPGRPTSDMAEELRSAKRQGCPARACSQPEDGGRSFFDDILGNALDLTDGIANKLIDIKRLLGVIVEDHNELESSCSQLLVRVRESATGDLETKSFGMFLRTEWSETNAPRHYAEDVKPGEAAFDVGLRDGDEILVLNKKFLPEIRHTEAIDAFHSTVIDLTSTEPQIVMVTRRPLKEGADQVEFEYAKITSTFCSQDESDAGGDFDDIDGGSRCFWNVIKIVTVRKVKTLEFIKNWVVQVKHDSELNWVYCKNGTGNTGQLRLKRGKVEDGDAQFTMLMCAGNIGRVRKTIAIITHAHREQECPAVLRAGKGGQVNFEDHQIKIKQHLVETSETEAFELCEIGDSYAFQSLARRGSFLFRKEDEVCLKHVDDFRSNSNVQFTINKAPGF
ncbi:hypothetical protein CAPTEDRAFT_189096 [Capitella teleta]|uniref:PDZ domain-containing protein n=1 Tax=Capitella teleta TaxID=283909 RepID=R7T8I0_CAPTE|nr:hypothetical protein CAPTEDRAFT_189096 [Capitella teleta]|eukprot:ELT87304.1 hypothetical protein CAPTEDRAFT_189096 [Capitella teleta]